MPFLPEIRQLSYKGMYRDYRGRIRFRTVRETMISLDEAVKLIFALDLGWYRWRS